jgi:hypothetical protein
LATCPLLFAKLFIYIIFFIIINKRKKWESGQKYLQMAQPCGFAGFTKVGKKWAKSGQSGQKMTKNPYENFPKSYFFHKKVGMDTFRKNKSGQKEETKSPQS